MRTVENHNSKEGMSFKMGINQFSDMTEKEFLDVYAIEKIIENHSDHKLQASSRKDPR